VRRQYFGVAPCGAFSHLLIVLRDRLVRRAISLIDTPSRKYNRRILPSKAMVITPSSPCHKKQQDRLNTLVNIQSASPTFDGQSSVGANT
jgi:hypothetical protein